METIELVKEINKIIKLLNEKHHLLTEIYNLSKYQLKFVENKEVEKLERLLQSKQIRMDKIDILDKEFLTSLESLKKEYNIEYLSELRVDSKYLCQLKDETNRVNSFLNKLMELDQEIQKISKKTYQDMKNQNKKIQTGKIARRGYERQESKGNGIYVNRKN